MRFVLIAVAFVLAACGASTVATTPETSQAATSATATAAPETTTAAASDAKFVGAWAAANADSCDGGEWTFTSTGVNTAGEVSCTFERVTAVEGGYDIEATCNAEGTPTHEPIQLRFPAEQAMHVHGGPWADVDLAQCVE